MTIIRRKKKEVEIDPNKSEDQEKAREILDKKVTPKGKADQVSKVVSFHFSVGNDDRARTIEQMIDDIRKLVKAVPYGKTGLHATTMGAYYILDGVVCLSKDYDATHERMIPGRMPPPWAGGTTIHPKPTKTDISGGKYDRPTLSAAEYDAKYKGLGNPSVIKDKPVTEDDLEELDWEEKDIGDDTQAEDVATKAIKNATRKLSIKKKISEVETVHKTRVVRRAK